MEKIQIPLTLYFLSFLISCLLDFIIRLDINQIFTSCLIIINIAIKWPKNEMDILLNYSWIGIIALIISGIFFSKTLYDLLWGDGLSW